MPWGRGGLGMGAGRRFDDHGLVQVGGGGGRGRELRGELPEAQVLAALVDQAEGGHVPEAGGAPVAQHHLVAVGQRQQLGQAVAQLRHREADTRLAMAGAQVAGGHAGQRVHRLGTDLGGAAAEPAVGGSQAGRDRDGGQVVGHRGHYRGESVLWRNPFRIASRPCQPIESPAVWVPSPNRPPWPSTPGPRPCRPPVRRSSGSGRVSPTSRRRTTSSRRPWSPAGIPATTTTRQPGACPS